MSCCFFVLVCWVTWQPSVSHAIDIYHFLVEYNNGRIAEKILSEPPEDYQEYFKDYVARTKLIEKRHYSVDGFIRTYGDENYELLMTGYFGFGMEEEIILNHEAQGLEADSKALPPPDEKSARLLEAWKSLEKRDGGITTAKPIPAQNRIDRSKEKKTTVSKPSHTDLPAGEKVKVTSVPPSHAEKETTKTFPDPGKKPAPEPHKKPRPRPDSPTERKITVYRFLAAYMNGKIMERQATVTPEQYMRLYRGYVKKVVLLAEKTYTENGFKDRFGRNAHRLLVQGNFGVGDIEMIMESRIRRGLPPQKNVLPQPGPENQALHERMEELRKNRIFTLQNDP